MLAAKLFRLYARLPFLQNPNDLLLRESALLHREFSSRLFIPENSHSHRTSFRGAGQFRILLKLSEKKVRLYRHARPGKRKAISNPIDVEVMSDIAYLRIFLRIEDQCRT
jgi:hypothetical protein